MLHAFSCGLKSVVTSGMRVAVWLHGSAIMSWQFNAPFPNAKLVSVLTAKLVSAATSGHLWTLTLSVCYLQVYSVQDSPLCLTGTAEIPLGAVYMDQILSEDQLPIKMAGFGHCFRTEAGAGGKPAE